jgi:hypothetical protein
MDRVRTTPERAASSGVVVTEESPSVINAHGHPSRREPRERRVVIARHAERCPYQPDDAALRRLILGIAIGKAAACTPRLERSL